MKVGELPESIKIEEPEEMQETQIERSISENIQVEQKVPEEPRVQKKKTVRLCSKTTKQVKCLIDYWDLILKWNTLLRTIMLTWLEKKKWKM